MADGTLAVAKAEVLAAVVTKRTEERFVECQAALLDGARRLPVDEVIKMARWWQRYADQDGAEPDEPDHELRLTQAADGTFHLRGVLDAETGEEFRTVLEGIARQLWRAERAGTEDQREQPPVSAGARLRAAALGEMARRATAADPDRAGGAIVDPGRAARTASADQWRLLRLRDRGCTSRAVTVMRRCGILRTFRIRVGGR